MAKGPIFFSYSRKDSEFVLDLAQKLRSNGIDVWLDQLDIKPGTAWDDAIEDALNISDTLLVVLSKTSVESKNVRDEYSFALEEGKKIVPVLIEDCTIPFRLRRLQYADFTTDAEIGMQTLRQSLGSEIKEGTKIPKKANRTKNLPFLVLGGIVLAAILYWIIVSILPSEKSTSSQLTVLVHELEGKDMLVLPNRGQVKLIYGDANVVETINDKGEATFKQIPAEFFEKESGVELLFSDPDGEPYKAVYPDSIYKLQDIDYISLAVQLEGLEEISGVVKNFETGEYIEGVRISISGIEVFTNEYGEYALEIPSDKQQKYQTVRAYKDGFENFELNNVPIQTNTEFPISLKPKTP